VKHSAARNNLRHEGRAHLQGLEEDTAPVCLQHPKSALHDVAGTGVLAVETSLHRVLLLYRLSVRGDEADGCTQAMIASIPEDALACR